MSETEQLQPASTPISTTPVQSGSSTQEVIILKQAWVPVVAIREGVIFPSTETVLTFGRQKSIQAIHEAMRGDKRVVFVSQRKDSIQDPGVTDLYTIGSLAVVDRTLKNDRELNALVRSVSRVRIEKLDENGAFLRALITDVYDIVDESPEIEALTKHLLTVFKQAVSLGKSVEFLNFMKLMSGAGPGELADQIASTLEISLTKKQQLLETAEVRRRLERVTEYLSKEVKVLEIERNIASKTQKQFDKHVREQVLRERMRTIRKELGEEDQNEEKELSDLHQAIMKAGMPAEVRAKAVKELKRLERMSINNPEGSYIRSWLDIMIEMPWNKRSKSMLSLQKAEKILNEDHFGLKEVKERILEYLAVMKLKSKQSEETQSKKSPTILCFVGAPGVGKTSIGKSIARALGRKFVKVSLGGIRDEAEIRGHRRTYVGAMPGRIIQGIKTAGTKNPVFMFDEIDKIGNDFRGDPSAAMLEALDPEQNHEFSDHYLEVPYDLSEVMFITTANILDTIPPALRDRLEIIEYSGYTEDEKFQIAKRHLMTKVVASNGLKHTKIEVPDAVLHDVIKLYTREAGVRSLERYIDKIVRKAAFKIAKGYRRKITLTKKMLDTMLGPARFLPNLAEKQDEIGLATGLAWTSVGGDVLFIECALMPGKGQVQLTGQLGKVMQESARAAFTYVRSHAKALGVDPRMVAKTDVHIHVPEGAVPKDGPSAGVTMTTAIVSAFTKKAVHRTVAMTGEVTLRGRVLEIGGLKEKVIAAHRAGITDVIIPHANMKDLREIPENVREDITFHPAEVVEDVLKVALVRAPKKITK
jgi:ATP-dependent Lon protease